MTSCESLTIGKSRADSIVEGTLKNVGAKTQNGITLTKKSNSGVRQINNLSPNKRYKGNGYTKSFSNRNDLFSLERFSRTSIHNVKTTNKPRHRRMISLEEANQELAGMKDLKEPMSSSPIKKRAFRSQNNFEVSHLQISPSKQKATV